MFRISINPLEATISEFVPRLLIAPEVDRMEECCPCNYDHHKELCGPEAAPWAVICLDSCQRGELAFLKVLFYCFW